MTISVVGLGALGARAVRQLISLDGVGPVLIWDDDPDTRRRVSRAMQEEARVVDSADQALDAEIVVLATPSSVQADTAAAAIRRGCEVVTTADGLDAVDALLDLDAEARERGRTVLVGAGFSPGLTCVLAAHAASDFDVVDEIHVAKVGTGGPACARQHHEALGEHARNWREGGWHQAPGGSGRSLAWFPEPIGGRDCYRAALAEPMLLRPAVPTAARITARLAANRRDRLTARLPMLRRPHPEGGPGAVRVEVRGRRGDARDVLVYGAMDRPAVAAGAVAAVAALLLSRDDADGAAIRRPGAAGLGEVVDPVPFLTALAERGVRAAAFEGDAVRG